MKKATIYDFARLCKAQKSCDNCPLIIMKGGKITVCAAIVKVCTDEANEMILKWCKGHPRKTRQSEFLKLFPNAKLFEGVIKIEPCKMESDMRYIPGDCCERHHVEDCFECSRKYWLAEVEE